MEQTQKGRVDLGESPKKGGEVLHWNKKEQLSFLWFLLLNLNEIYQKDSKRVKKRLFTLMSQFIPTRQPTQCRTHFCRLIKQKEENGDVKLFISKKLFKCFCCQKNDAKGIAKLIEQYLIAQKITNLIFKQNLLRLEENIEEVYLVGKSVFYNREQFLQLNQKFEEKSQQTNNREKNIKKNPQEGLFFEEEIEHCSIQNVSQKKIYNGFRPIIL